MLVLLVFFISITATSALRSDRAIELPVGPNATKKATARSEALINVKWVPEKSAGVVAIESKVITDLPAVTEMLSPRSKADPNLPRRHSGRSQDAGPVRREGHVGLRRSRNHRHRFLRLQPRLIHAHPLRT